MPNRYIFRFIHHRSRRGWAVRDTVSGLVFGSYANEDLAVGAALAANARHSAYRQTSAFPDALDLL